MKPQQIVEKDFLQTLDAFHDAQLTVSEHTKQQSLSTLFLFKPLASLTMLINGCLAARDKLTNAAANHSSRLQARSTISTAKCVNQR